MSFGPTPLSPPTDSGVTWSKPANIYDRGANSQTIINIIQVAPDGCHVLHVHRWQSWSCT